MVYTRRLESSKKRKVQLPMREDPKQLLQVVTEQNKRNERRLRALAIREEALRKRLKILKQEVKQVKDRYKITEDELQLAQTQKEQARQLLEDRTAELMGARLFLDQANAFSGADIINAIKSLNYQILQAAAIIVDSVNFSVLPRSEEEVLRFDKAREQATISLGEELMHVLDANWRHSGSDSYTTLVQIALQAYMVTFCLNVVKTWSQKEEETRVLADVYSRIHAREQQAVAGRWRSITRAALKPDDPKTMIGVIMDTVFDILLAIGGYTEIFFERFQETLGMVVDGALRLRTMTEGITSMEVVPFFIPPGMVFDPETMDDTYAGVERVTKRHPPKDLQAIADNRVVAMTELGLMRFVKGPADISQCILLKPKVVLHSALQEPSEI